MTAATAAPVRAVRVPHGSGKVAFAARSLGELLITAGVLVLLFVAYLLYWTDFQNDRIQSRLTKQLDTTFAAAAAPGAPVIPAQEIQATGGVDTPGVPLGKGFAEIYIPRLGKSYHKIVVEGTGTDQLDLGPGHYDGTALPGQDGNFAVAGHRTTHGEPFNRLAEVKAGDHVVFQTRSAWVTYVVTGETVVPADPSTDGAAILTAPPAIGDQQSSKKLLTLTTCNPEYSATQRLILRGVWVSTDVKKPGFVPAALQSGT